MSKPAKQPQDRQKKAADRLRKEAAALPGMDELAGLTITVEGRHGKATVTALPSPLDWDADVFAFLREGDYLSAICGTLSNEDAALLRAVKPSIGSLMAALMEPPEDSSEPSVGESQAS